MLANNERMADMNEALALERRVWDLLGRNDIKLAINTCETLNHDHPGYASGWHTTSHLALKLGNGSMAVSAIDKALSLEPDKTPWLLQKAHAGLIPRAYHIYRTRWGPDADNAVRFREPHCRAVRVRFLGVWDTVGALGIPIKLFDGLNEDRYGFHDTTISRIVEHACHALAIDERRKPFAPTIWKTRSGRKRTEQAWFSGSHADIGGGHREAGLSLISLHWIASQAAQAGLALDQTLLDRVLSRNTREVVHDTVPLAYRIFGTAERAIGITNPDEILHPSAEQRFLREPDYRPRNLVEYLARDEQIRLPI